jgi:hypothetical protein
MGDLEGRVLRIERNLSLEVLGPTETNRNRRLTLGVTTAAMLVEHFDSWRMRVDPDAIVGEWVFAPDWRRLTNARADLLLHRFDRLRRVAGLPEAALHGCATAWLPISRVKARSSKPRPAPVTEIRRRHCATTPTPCRSMTRTSPTRSTRCSTAGSRPRESGDCVLSDASYRHVVDGPTLDLPARSGSLPPSSLRARNRRYDARRCRAPRPRSRDQTLGAPRRGQERARSPAERLP